MSAAQLNAIVTLVNRISPWLMLLQVVPDGWTMPEFRPGQYVAIGLVGAAARCNLAEPQRAPAEPRQLIRRAYCIASSPANHEFVEFFIHLVPHGALTPRLFALKIGDRIWLSDHITGGFTFDHVPADANVALIATGTGLAPYVSMLSTHLRFGVQRRIAVLYGARNSWDLGYRAILMTMQHLRNNVTYLLVISRPADEPIERDMTYVVTENCIKCKFMDCVPVCPVNCFYEGRNMLVIDPDECIDCDACRPACPAQAIKPDSGPGLERWLNLNADFAKRWPKIRMKKKPAVDAKTWSGVPDKFERYFDPKPGGSKCSSVGRAPTFTPPREADAGMRRSSRQPCGANNMNGGRVEGRCRENSNAIVTIDAEVSKSQTA